MYMYEWVSVLRSLGGENTESRWHYFSSPLCHCCHGHLRDRNLPRLHIAVPTLEIPLRLPAVPRAPLRADRRRYPARGLDIDSVRGATPTCFMSSPWWYSPPVPPNRANNRVGTACRTTDSFAAHLASSGPDPRGL